MNLCNNKSLNIKFKQLKTSSRIIEKNIETLRVFHRIGKTEDGHWEITQ